MENITDTEAVLLVRKNMDELQYNDSVMLSSENNDNPSIDNIIKKTLPEAINIVQAGAPSELLEGISTGVTVGTGTGARDITVAGHEVLRVVRCKASDSDMVVTAAFAEDSPEGRKQLNEYTRGTFDDPRLIQLADRSSQVFRYYSTKTSGATVSFTYVEKYKWASGVSSYAITEALRQNIVHQLTGMVLEILGDADKANYFLELAKQYE